MAPFDNPDGGHLDPLSRLAEGRLLGYALRMLTSAPNTRCIALDGRTTSTFVEVHALDQAAKLKLAFKRLLVFWGIALLFIPVPALHFVMVPGFLAIGLVAFAYSLTVRSYQTSPTELACPSCGQPVALASIIYRGPIKELCPSCRHAFRIEITSP